MPRTITIPRLILALPAIMLTTLLVGSPTAAGPGCKLGITMKPADSYGLQIEIVNVFPGSPADKGGLRANDLLIMVGNTPAFGSKSMEQIVSTLDATPCGETIRVMFRRNGIPYSVDIPLLDGKSSDTGSKENSSSSSDSSQHKGAPQPKVLESDPNAPSPEAVAVGTASFQAAIQAVMNSGPKTLPPQGASVVSWIMTDKPADYPAFAGKSQVVPLTIESATRAREEAESFRKLTRREFDEGYYLGRTNFEGELGRKMVTSMLSGVEVGGATLSFYLMTPFSEARYRFYQAKQQFEPLSSEEIVQELGRVKSAYIVVLQNADVQRLAGNLAGFGSLVYNKIITKVIIKRGETVYQPLGNSGAGWAFPMGVFGGADDLEVVAVSSDNRHATVMMSGADIDSYR